MTTAKKIFRIKLPLTLDEYRRGFRYALSKYTTDEVTYKRFERNKELDKVTTTTLKTLNLTGRMPTIVKKVIPTAACFVEEFSTNIDTLVVERGDDKYTHFHQVTKTNQGDKIVNKECVIDDLNQNGKEQTIKDEKIFINDNEEMGCNLDCGHSTETLYKNMHFDEKTFKMKMVTKVCKNKDFKFEEYKAEVVDLDFREIDGKIKTKIGGRDYSGNYEKKYGCIYVFKYVEIELNSFGLGWIAKEILKVLKGNLLEIQQCTMKWYDQWADLNDQEIEKHENETLKKHTRLV